MLFTLTMPKLSPTMEEGMIVKWHKKEGEKVEAGDLLFEISTDKATVEYNALDEGWLRKIIVGEKKTAKLNEPVAVFSEEKDESIEGYIPKEEPVFFEKKEERKEQPTGIEVLKELQIEQLRSILASPLAKKIAKERGIDLSLIKGSGPNQRIMSRDLAQAKDLTQKSGNIEEIALTPMRKVIASRLIESKITIPHFYVRQIIEAKSLIEMREQLKQNKENITFNDMLVKACAIALKKHPIVNRGFNSKEQKILQFNQIDISVAVSVQEGVITPIVFQADTKSLKQINEEMLDLAKRAREGKLNPREYQGGSFSISNLGMYGIPDFQAIINPPQAAVLAIGGILDTPIIKDGIVIAGKTMSLTLSADHRVIDGVAAAEFLVSLKMILESPAILLF